ncbi:MAG: glycosyltransferase family 4 protein [Phycisphaerae bacterium]|jgi:glycosyltransferase involved in cell wall biosynthesis
MHIAYVHQYFATPRGSTGTRSYEFARRWAAAGHRVTVITSTAQLTAADVPGGDISRRRDFVIDGVRVIALPVAYSQKMGKPARMAAFARFMLASTWTLLRLRDVDVVYATSTPLTVAVPALVRRWLRKTPYIFEVRDLWPAVPVELGYLLNRWLIRTLRGLERRAYLDSAGVVALSPGMRDAIAAVVAGRRDILVAPNCCDLDRFRPDLDGQKVRRKLGWEGRFVCLHAGAMGQVNGLDQLIRVADRLREDPAFLFVLAGDGRERPALVDQVRRRGLGNVRFVGGGEIRGQLVLGNAADVCLVTVAPHPVLEHNSANKLFDALSAGRPVAINYSGWQRDLLEAEQAGLGCARGDEGAFAANLRWLKDHPSERAEMGRRARLLAETRFSRDRLAAEVLAFIQRLTAHG